MNTKHPYRFRIAVEKMEDTSFDSIKNVPLIFEIDNHDDILAIVERVRTGTAFSMEDASALALGLKLFSGVMLKYQKDPLFSAVQPAIRTFIGNLKSRVASFTIAE